MHGWDKEEKGSSFPAVPSLQAEAVEHSWNPAGRQQRMASSVGTAQANVDAETEGCRAAQGAKSPCPLQ